MNTFAQQQDLTSLFRMKRCLQRHSEEVCEKKKERHMRRNHKLLQLAENLVMESALNEINLQLAQEDDLDLGLY